MNTVSNVFLLHWYFIDNKIKLSATTISRINHFVLLRSNNVDTHMRYKHARCPKYNKVSIFRKHFSRLDTRTKWRLYVMQIYSVVCSLLIQFLFIILLLRVKRSALAVSTPFLTWPIVNSVYCYSTMAWIVQFPVSVAKILNYLLTDWKIGIISKSFRTIMMIVSQWTVTK